MNPSLMEPPLTMAKLKEIPTVLEAYDCNDSRSIPPGVLMIFANGPELNDLIRGMLPVGACAEIITWSFQPTVVGNLTPIKTTMEN
jgi:hypothetical protein